MEGRVWMQPDSLDRIRRASELAVEEFRVLNSQFEEEKRKRVAAEKISRQSISEMHAARRQSAILMAPHSEQQLSDSLSEIQQLSEKLAMADARHQDEIEKLKSQVAALQENAVVEENKSINQCYVVIFELSLFECFVCL